MVKSASEREPSKSKLSRSKAGSGSLNDASAICREPACEHLPIGSGYCRLHYIKNWQKIKRKQAILEEGKLRRYIEELIAKYPDKYVESIRQDLMRPETFAKVVHELDLVETDDELIEIEAASALEEDPVERVRPDIDDRSDEF